MLEAKQARQFYEAGQGFAGRPGDLENDPIAGRATKSAHETLKAKGCIHTEAFGWDRPRQPTDRVECEKRGGL